MIAAGLHQTSKENDERSAALQQAGQYRISQLAYNACGYVKEILTPVIKGARDFAIEADARNLIIACYALNRLRPYITLAVRHLFLDVANRMHHYLTRFVASAGSSAATVALGSLLTVYNQSRNFLASAGSVLAAPSAAAVALSAAPVNTPISPAPGSAVSTDEAARAAPKKSDNSRGPKGSDGGAGPAPAEHGSGGGPAESVPAAADPPRDYKRGFEMLHGGAAATAVNFGAVVAALDSQRAALASLQSMLAERAITPLISAV